MLRHLDFHPLHLTLLLLLALPLNATASENALPSPAATDRIVAASNLRLLPELRSLAPGQTVRLGGLALEADAPAADLVLERFEVFKRDAEIVVHGAEGDRVLPAPNNIYLRGAIEGRPRSLAVLTVREAGDLRGLIAESGKLWVLAAAEAGANLALRSVDLTQELIPEVSFSCGADHLSKTPEALADLLSGGPTPATAPVTARPSTAVQASYTATVALETDFEYFQRFGNTTDATDYAGDLVAWTSTLYDNEFDTDMQIGHLSLWSTNTDPWTQTSTTCLLYEYGRYWNDNRTNIDRTSVHFLSGRGSLAGVAWVGVLCSSGFNVDHQGSCGSLTPQVSNYGGDYAYSSGISGSFDINNPSAVWDIVVFAHEAGHNFNSPHTHCYANLEGNVSPVDECFSGQCGQTGCHCGATSLPCALGGGNGCGTIMSYCHFLSGNLGNIGLTLGQGHPHGVSPGRVPTRMGNHVASRASSNPGCLDLVVSSIFDDGFESGNTSSWSVTLIE